MPWQLADPPRATVHLSPTVRAKAIDIANALLADGMDEGRALRIAIAQAERWAARRGLAVRAVPDGSDEPPRIRLR